MSDHVERDSMRFSSRLHGGLQYPPFFVFLLGGPAGL